MNCIKRMPSKMTALRSAMGRQTVSEDKASKLIGLPLLQTKQGEKKERKPLLPFRWPGGKYYALDHLRPFWVSVPHDEYREPFAGGASVFFAKSKVRWNWVNDVDPSLMATYRVLADPILRVKLADEISKESASVERWKEVKNLQPTNDYELAYRFYYMNRTSFSGKLSSPAWGYRPHRSLPPERWPERIIPCGTMLEDVELTCKDFAEVISAPARGKKVLMYIDPPYFCPPRNKHYVNGFTYSDHLRLADMLSRSEHDFFLTYEENPDIRKLYEWAHIYPIEFVYRVNNSKTDGGKRRRGKEVVITNYTLPEQSTIDAYGD